MSKLVRARVKAVEHLPDWAKCCAESLEEIAELGECIIDMADLENFGPGECKYCAEGYGKDLVGARIVGRSQYAPFELIDLDEGPLEVADKTA